MCQEQSAYGTFNTGSASFDRSMQFAKTGCKYCGRENEMVSRDLCSWCYTLKTLIDKEPAIAEKILKDINSDKMMAVNHEIINNMMAKTLDTKEQDSYMLDYSIPK